MFIIIYIQLIIQTFLIKINNFYHQQPQSRRTLVSFKLYFDNIKIIIIRGYTMVQLLAAKEYHSPM